MTAIIYGAWISPQGKIESLAERPGTEFDHERAIILNPSHFGVSPANLPKSLGGDRGDSREEVIESALQNGWTRVRKYAGRGSYYGVTVWKLTRQIKKNIEAWAQQQNEPDKFIPVRIVSLAPGILGSGVVQAEFKDVRNGYLSEARSKGILEEILNG